MCTSCGTRNGSTLSDLDQEAMNAGCLMPVIEISPSPPLVVFSLIYCKTLGARYFNSRRWHKDCCVEFSDINTNGLWIKQHIDCRRIFRHVLSRNFGELLDYTT